MLLNTTVQCQALPAIKSARAPFQPSQTLLIAVACVAVVATIASLLLVRTVVLSKVAAPIHSCLGRVRSDMQQSHAVTAG